MARRSWSRARFEALESRVLLSHVEFLPNTPIVANDQPGLVIYEPRSKVLRVNATADTFRPSPESAAVTIQPASTSGERLFRIAVPVDHAGRFRRGDMTSEPLVVVGAVDTDSDGSVDADGTLLTGQIISLEFVDDEAFDQFELVFSLTGGQLAPLFATGILRVVITSNQSSFHGSFANRFEGTSKIVLGATASLATDIELQKLTNGFDADDPNGIDVPEISLGTEATGLAASAVDHVTISSTHWHSAIAGGHLLPTDRDGRPCPG